MGGIAVTSGGEEICESGIHIHIKKLGEEDKVTLKFKARLVYRNHPFVNTSSWDHVFASVADKATLRIFFTIAGRYSFVKLML